MKKIMIALAVAAMAVASQAAQIKWSASNIFAGNTTNKYSGTAYLFDAGILAQSALFDAFAADMTMDMTKASGYVGQSTVSASGAIGSTVTTYGAEDKAYSFYFAVVKDDSIYMSNIKDVTTSASATTATTTAFQSQNNGTTTFSATAAAEGFQGAGHWSQAVPEPTSALMLLVGLVGLALKRKVA